MSGGENDVAPGDYLLQLLRNPPQFTRHQQTHQILINHDPAVAAVGPTVPTFSPPYQTNNYHHNHHGHVIYSSDNGVNCINRPLSTPHSFFVQNPNPNLMGSSSLLQRPGFDQIGRFNQQLGVDNGVKLGSLSNSRPDLMFGQQLGVDDAVKLGSLSNSRPDMMFGQQLGVDHGVKLGSLSNSRPDMMFGQQFGVDNGAKLGSLTNSRPDVIFGSFDARNNAVGGVPNLNGNRVPNVLDIKFQKNLEISRNNGVGVGVGGGNRWGATPIRRPGPPGFNNGKNKSGGFEQNVGKGKSKSGEGNYGNVSSGRVSGERRLSGQLDNPGLPAGSKVHSVDASDIEEARMVLHSEVGGDRGKGEEEDGKSELVELEGIVDALVLDDEPGDKEDKKKRKSSRDKDYRSDKRGKCILNQRMRISKRHIKCRRDIHRMNMPFLEIYESLIPSEEEKAKQKQLMALLEKHVNKEWPDARLYLYGSCANSFGFKNSDIDVCLAIDDADVNKSEVLLKLADILQSDNLQNVQALTRARVPIVKLMDPVTGISGDICVNNLLAVINTKLLRDYALIDERLRQLAFIIKHWAKSRGVNETYQGTLSSYAYVLMCINFLQQRRPAILPCLQVRVFIAFSNYKNSFQASGILL
ncbi:hypothetical protein AgCh_019198 [Apium graveolens]